MREATLDQDVKVFQRPNASWSAFIQETARFGPILKGSETTTITVLSRRRRLTWTGQNTGVQAQLFLVLQEFQDSPRRSVIGNQQRAIPTAAILIGEDVAWEKVTVTLMQNARMDLSVEMPTALEQRYYRQPTIIFAKSQVETMTAATTQDNSTMLDVDESSVKLTPGDGDGMTGGIGVVAVARNVD